ncbi:MAG: ammonia channel protein, partial [Acidimicrobiales bacterium]
ATGVLCYLALGIKRAAGFDDSLDVIAVHLVGGLFGSIVLGLFADPKVNAIVTEPGLLITDGGVDLLLDQLVASGVTLAYSFGASLVIAKVLDLAMGLRVDEETEDAGLDLAIHAETAYAS